jgi:hypothetical protein
MADVDILAGRSDKIEEYEKRFGLIAIDKGFIRVEDLVKALTIQVGEDVRKIPHRLLGEIFFHMGLMTDKQIDEVLGTIFRKVR